MNEDNRQTATQAEPDEIARRYRLERIERAVKYMLESGRAGEYERATRALADLAIAYHSPPKPPPDEPRLTRMELIALVEDAEQYLAESAYKDEYERDKRTRAESRAAIAKARDLIGRGEDRLYPERFALAPEPDEPALTFAELNTLAMIAEDYYAQAPARPVEWTIARDLAERLRRLASVTDSD